MNIADLLKNETANIHLTVTATDLAEFAETIVKQTIEQTTQQHKDKLIPRRIVCKVIPDATLVVWKRKGYLTPVYIGAKAFYKQSDLEERNIFIDNEKVD
ncbi:MAG: hypothetical protein MJ204_02830 [Bacteroidales bacterium]|nr:hypothetical protein [Bacteroidales bacterium]MCQ2605463.1 hypothetical protein [Bacteroidales bacterium]